jgi:hypothetical protein
MATAQQTPPPSWLQTIDNNRRPVGQALLVLGGGLLLLAAFLWYRYAGTQAPLIAASLLVALACATGGLWFVSGPSESLSGTDAARLLVLVEGAVFGLALIVFTFWQMVLWWKDVSSIEAWRGENRWHPWLLVGTALAGLAVMFFSLLLARGEENASRTLRVMLYGYNAILTGLLLLAVLVGLNVLAYVFVDKTSDWTATGIYTLDPKSQEVLKGLSQPVRIYVLEEERGTALSKETHELMENVRSASDKVQVEYLLRDLNIDSVGGLLQKYKLTDDTGVLVVYGSGEDELHHFIRQSDLMQMPPMQMDPDAPRRPPAFKGEDQLISAISFMEEGQKKPVVYFVQGNGCIDLFGLDPAAKANRRARALADRLGKDHYEVKGLMLSDTPLPGLDPRVTVSASVPADASVVVVAGPREKFTDKQLDALRRYMGPTDPKQKKGKMMALLDAAPDPDDPKKIGSSGIERLLSEFDVDVPAQRVLRPDAEAPDWVRVNTNPDLRGKNPLATAFDMVVFPLRGVRPVQPRAAAGAPPGAGGTYHVDRLLGTSHPVNQLGRIPVFTDSSPGDPRALVIDLLQNHRAELEKRLVASVPVGVAVADSAPADANDVHAFMRQQRGEGAPRLVVIGSTGFATDAEIIAGARAAENPDAPSVYYDLFSSALAWLREKPSSIGITHKDRDVYKIQNSAEVNSMLVTPFLLMFFGVIGLGLGVWVVRRR